MHEVDVLGLPSQFRITTNHPPAHLLAGKGQATFTVRTGPRDQTPSARFPRLFTNSLRWAQEPAIIFSLLIQLMLQHRFVMPRVCPSLQSHLAHLLWSSPAANQQQVRDLLKLCKQQLEHGPQTRAAIYFRDAENDGQTR